MNVAAWCIKNNRTALVLLLLIVVGGIMSYFSIGRLENPDFTIRTALVQTVFPGASPQKVEQLVTDTLEEAIRSIPELDTVTSQSMTGTSLIFVSIKEKYYDMKPIWDRLRIKVEQAAADLPEGAHTPVVNDEFGDVYGVVVALTGDGYTYRELKDAADDTRDELLKIGTVAKVDLFGTQEERVFVEFSNARLADTGFSPNQLAQSLAAQNAVQPGGKAVVEGESVVLEATGEFGSVEDLRLTTFAAMGSSEAIYLEDIADVRRGFVDPPTTLARFNGERAIVIAVNMVKGSNVSDMGEAVTARLAELQANLPLGLDFEMLAYQPTYVDRAIQDFMGNLAQAFLFVVIVMLLFAGLRMGLIAGSLIPVAMLMCMALLPSVGVELQQISIASLIIALGMLVDNGVVVSENILVRMGDGEERLSAATDAVTELKWPLLAASLTTICAFMPIAIADSAVGEFCLSMFIVVSLTLVCSWILALTLVPTLCYYFLKPKRQAQTFERGIYPAYRRFLLYCLRHRGRFLVAIVALFLISMWGFQFVPKLFFPANEREMFYVDFWQPYGTDIRTTAERAEELEAFLSADEEVVSVAMFVGSGGPRWYLSLSPEQNNANYAFLLVNTRTTEGVAGVIARAQTWLEDHLPDGRIRFNLLENGPPVGYPIQVRLSGDDLPTLYRLRDRLAELMADTAGVSGIHDDWGEWAKKLEVDVLQEQAKRAGLTSQDVALSLMTQISGLEATELREGSEIIPVILRSQEAYRADLGKVEGLNVYSYSSGRSVPLLTVAQSHLVWQPSNIRRRDAKRTMTLQADVHGRFSSEAIDDLIPRVDALMASEEWPAGYSVEFGGEDEESAEAQASIAAGFPLAFGLMILILVSQFNSFRRPLIIALTIPPMMIGITWGMLLTQAPFGFMAMLGMISLMGIIVNNAIMMIDRIEIERETGRSLEDAIVGSAMQRMRPILMTATTTIVGLIPLSLQGGEFWRPMANCIIFGLAFATVLTLVLCPVLYALFFRARFADYRWERTS